MEFEWSMKIDQIISGGGITMGFVFGSTAGEDMGTLTDPELRTGFTRPRVVISTICDPAGKMQFWEYKNSEGGRGTSCSSGDACQESISGAIAGDTIGFVRNYNSATGKCVISVTKNGSIIKTANTHEWGSTTEEGCGSGYMFVGHYNRVDPQCISDASLTM
jgi:hypothetical protein